MEEMKCNTFEEFYHKKMSNKIEEKLIQNNNYIDKTFGDFTILLSHDTVLDILLMYMDCLSILNLFQSHVSIKQQIIDRDFVQKRLREKYISSRQIECTNLSDKSDAICLSLIKVKLKVNKNIKRDDIKYGKTILSKVFETFTSGYPRLKQSQMDDILKNGLDFPCCLPFDLTNPQN
eukprot:73729_1